MVTVKFFTNLDKFKRMFSQPFELPTLPNKGDFISIAYNPDLEVYAVTHELSLYSTEVEIKIELGIPKHLSFNGDFTSSVLSKYDD